MKISSAFRSFSFRRLAGGLAAAVALSLPTAAPAAMLATDNAGNYATWTNGSNGGTGFGAWDLTSNNNNGTTLFAGYFLGDSTAGSGNINTGGQSFAVFANPNTAFANASRTFSGGALTLGQKFSIQLAVNFRNGGKGINLFSGATQIGNFNTGNNDYNYIAGAGGSSVSTGYAYSATSVFTISYTQTTAATGTLTISRAGDAPINQTFTASGVTSFTLYNSNTDNGNAANNLYFNNLSVVPEPSAIAMVAVGMTGLVVARRRRR